MDRAIRIENLVAKFLSIQHSCSNSNSIFEVKEIKKIANTLMKEHAPFSKYQQQHEGIIPGVRCTSCERFNMVRNMRSWYCPDCGELDRNAHQQAIYDYLLLVSPIITNKQAREFLGVESSRVANLLLNNMNLTSKGKGKG